MAAPTISSYKPPDKESRGVRANSPLECDLQTLRKKHHISQAELAEVFGITRGQIANIEAGMCPSFDLALKIARFFETDVQKIWRLKNDD